MLTKFVFFPKIAVYYKKLIKIITANYANKFLVIFYNFGSEKTK